MTNGLTASKTTPFSFSGTPVSWFPKGETALIATFSLALFFIKLLANFHYRIDSDEPQHVHVVWLWLHGQVAYRDFFDNHTPGFHLLCVPLLRLLGEHSRTLLLLRLTSVAAYAGCLCLARNLLRTFTSRRVATWSALALGAFPPFFLTTTEFRPDILWTLLWLATLCTLVRSRGRPGAVGKAFFSLGLAFCVSMKSVLLLIALVVAAVVLVLADERAQRPLNWSGLSACAFSATGGLAIAPTLLVLYFWAHGALRNVYECTVQHNLLPGDHSAIGTLARLLQWLLLMAIPAGACGWAWRQTGKGTNGRRSIFLWLVAAALAISLRCFWRFLTPEDYLPVFALLVPLGAAALLSATASWGTLFAAPACTAVLLTVTCWDRQLFQNATHQKLHLVADVLRLTEADTPVMDAKGETMFRPRASRLVLEHLTNLRVKKGLLQDDISEELVAKRVPVVSDFKLLTKDQLFTQQYYVTVAWRLRVLGHALQPTFTPSGVEWRFATVIPADYSFIDPQGPVQGEVDGKPSGGMPVYLVPGAHVFRCENHAGPVAYEWSHAFEKGFSPFGQLAPDVKRPED